MKLCLFLFAFMLFDPQLKAHACETTKITFTGTLNSQTLVGNGPPSILAPVNEQVAAAQVVKRITIFDSLNKPHSALAAFYRIGEPVPWVARLIVDDINLDTSYNTLRAIGDSYLVFDIDGNRVPGGSILYISYKWLNSTGMNHSIVIDFQPNNYSANDIQVEQDGNADGCAKRSALDFDGDGLDDFAIWRPEFGLWAVMKSTNPGNEFIFKQWGLPGDYPIPGDYTGDGKADLVIYRGTTALWFVCKSELNFDCAQPLIVQFGLPGDIPIKGDYDGDGTMDFAVYRLSSGTFFYRSSKTSELKGAEWGLSKDIPLQAVINQRP